MTTPIPAGSWPQLDVISRTQAAAVEPDGRGLAASPDHQAPLNARDLETVRARGAGGSRVASTPDWVISQRRARGDCECCGERAAATEWAGNGQMICWECCDSKRRQGLG